MSTNRAYSNELRADSSAIIIPIVSGLYVTLALIGLANFVRLGTNRLWPYIIIIVISPAAARAAWEFIHQNRNLLGTALFLFVHMLLISIVYYQSWQTGSPIPYFFIIFTVLASMLLWPAAGLYTWNISTFLILVVNHFAGELSIANTVYLVPALALNLMIAIAMYLSALEWQTAVESVSILHRRAQERRDELFTVKEEITHSNERLTYLNQQLDVARQQAVTERDIRTRFMNNVSHELRTPLNSIVNFGHILREGGAGPVTDWQRDYLDRIEKSGWHLLNILNDLLDMAQIESGEFKLYLEVTDLQNICDDAIASVQGLILEKEGLELVVDYPQSWPIVHVDRTRLKQAIINLIGNAAKYTETGYIALRVRKADEFAHISVEDTGIGIAPEYHEVIFQEFRQIDETAARKRIGTGLGLPITRHLIERHGGQVALDSEPGKGSTFTIILPLYREETTTSEQEETAVSLTPTAA
ncbi:MAG: HAMP domain-containing histidine kinase [Anaerolineales bacterium]|nr:HAMP domain-containing histidine kinase [Anaerolineales bacterium]